MNTLTQVTLNGLSINHQHAGRSLELVRNFNDLSPGTAVENVTIGWSRPTVRDHQSPGHLSLQVFTANAAGARQILQPDGKITVVVILNAPTGPPLTWVLGQGWVTGGSYHRHPSRRGWLVHINCIDVIGLAAATALPAQVLPAAAGNVRASLLNDLTTSARIIPDEFPPAYARETDTTGQTLLEAIHAITPPGWRILEAAVERRLACVATGRPRIEWGWKTPPLTPITKAEPAAGTVLAEVAPILATSIEDTARTLDRTNMVTTIRVAHKALVADPEANPDDPGSWEDKTTEYRRASRMSDAVHTIAVDYHHRDPLGTGYTRWAADLLRAAYRALSSIEGTRLLLGTMDPATIRRITEMGPRTRTVVNIAGAPADLPAGALFNAQTITIHGHWGRAPTMAVTADLVDASLAGIRSLTFRDAPTTDQSYLLVPRFNTMGTVTLEQTRFADAANPPWP